MSDKHDYDAAIAATREATSQGLSVADLRAVHRSLVVGLSEPRRSVWLWLAPVGLTACLAAIVALVLLWPTTVPVVREPMRMVDAAGTRTLLDDNGDISLGQGLRTRLNLGGEAEAFVVGPAHVHFVAREPHVIAGAVAFSVVPRAAGTPPYRVHIGSDQVIVHGTKFVVFASDDALSQVSVREGVVEVRHAGATTGRFLYAGDAYLAQEAVAADADKVWAAMESRILYVPTPEPSPAPVKSDRKPVRDEKPRPRVERPDVWAAATASLRAKRCAVLHKQVVDLVRESTSDEDKAQAQLLDAECAVRQGDKREALGLYEGVVRSYPDTASAETALFEIATLQGDSHERSLAAVESYLRRYPKGRFTDATSFRRCELLIQLSRLPEARGCLEQYRRDFPSGQRTPASLLLLATLSRINQSWQEAADLYAQYAATKPDKLEEALYYRVVCLRRGALAGADQAADDYLKRFPDGAHAADVRGK